MTWAPRPRAIFVALMPTVPAPRTTTDPGLTPGTPPRRMPRPPAGFSRHHAPTCGAMRPAISLMGTRRAETRRRVGPSRRQRPRNRREERPGQLLVRREVEIRKDDLPTLQEGVFLREGFLDLDDELRRPRLFCRHERGARLFVLGIGDAAPHARPRFDADGVAPFHEGRHAARHHGDAFSASLISFGTPTITVSSPPSSDESYYPSSPVIFPARRSRAGTPRTCRPHSRSYRVSSTRGFSRRFPRVFFPSKRNGSSPSRRSPFPVRCDPGLLPAPSC